MLLPTGAMRAWIKSVIRRLMVKVYATLELWSIPRIDDRDVDEREATPRREDGA